MTFTKVDYPITKGDSKERTARKDIATIFDEFMAMQTKAARFDFSHDEYKDSKSAFLSLYKAQCIQRYPIKIQHRMGDVYFIRTDM